MGCSGTTPAASPTWPCSWRGGLRSAHRSRRRWPEPWRFDLDGDFDLFVANYGPSALYRQAADRKFVDEARLAGITFDGHATTSAVGDVNGDGRPDLYVGAFLAPQPHYRDWLYLNRGSADALRFVEALPALLLTQDASHGVQLVDFDAEEDSTCR